ncbi:hypothetical protein G5V59_24355 [Nocardioides sp. W3-2-3]|uniref:hypothetical protein n=1 Tax=Nocardioides convexus TaxID=2712224 RepID=UPI002418920C|nr:hypothetical protein [Nocardioides convexus]NHA01771.1 hypothetical protein [Nocardioides convexus]
MPGNNGPAPSVDLSYSSQSVDGRTAASNNQSSHLGEGWDAGDAYIERGYATCKDDGVAGKYDLCWKTDNAHLVLNGSSAESHQARRRHLAAEHRRRVAGTPPDQHGGGQPGQRQGVLGGHHLRRHEVLLRPDRDPGPDG